jgi:hypothetical protein
MNSNVAVEDREVRTRPRRSAAAPVAEGVGDRGKNQGVIKFTVTFFLTVKLSSMPSNENSRPMPLCLTPP